jgi:hypothetical protein
MKYLSPYDYLFRKQYIYVIYKDICVNIRSHKTYNNYTITIQSRAVISILSPSSMQSNLNNKTINIPINITSTIVIEFHLLIRSTPYTSNSVSLSLKLNNS